MNPEKIIKIGIIGTGFARSTQIPGFRACEGARVVAIASGHRENAERVARDFGIEHATDDWREVISRDDVDLISIVTPPSTHMEMTLAALDAGKAVLCEKPTAMNAEEAAGMLARAEERNALALIDHELRFLPARRMMRDRVRDGAIGRVHHVKYFFRADSRAKASRPWNWWSDAGQGGGVLGAIGSHAIDSLRWLLNTEVSSVAARLATQLRERVDEESGKARPVTSDDEANLLLQFDDSALTSETTGTVSMSVVEHGRPRHRVEIFGSDGALMNEGNELWQARTGEGRWSRVETESGELSEGMQDSEWSRGFTAFSCAIIARLREGERSVKDAATFTDGYRNQLVLDCARRSHETGRTEEIEKG